MDRELLQPYETVSSVRTAGAIINADFCAVIDDNRLSPIIGAYPGDMLFFKATSEAKENDIVMVRYSDGIIDIGPYDYDRSHNPVLRLQEGPDSPIVSLVGATILGVLAGVFLRHRA